MMTEEERKTWKDEVAKEYYEDNMKKMKRFCFPIIKKIGGITVSDYDDLFGLAQLIMAECMEKYDDDNKKGCSFDTFFRMNLGTRLYATCIRDRNRKKRCNYIDGKDGEKVFLHNISFDAPTDDGIDLREKIGSAVNVENLHTGSCRWEKYLSNLSNRQKKIAVLLSEGFSVTEIRDMLCITEKEYRDDMVTLKAYDNISILLYSEED